MVLGRGMGTGVLCRSRMPGMWMSIYSVKDESKKVGFKRGGWHQNWIRE